MPKKDIQIATKIAYLIYCLYIATLMIPILPILAVIFAYVFENDADSYLKSHYQYLIRTFWLAILYFTLSSILIMGFIGVILIPLCVLWWIVRIVKGLKSLLNQKPIENPYTWWF